LIGVRVHQGAKTKTTEIKRRNEVNWVWRWVYA